MPAFLEAALRKTGKKKGFSGKHLDKYVFGGMNNKGAMRGNEVTPRGRAMERKHQEHVSGFGSG